MSAAGADPLELREVLGPTAFGTTRKRFWELLWLSTLTDFRMRYVDAVFGYFWALVQPLLTFGIIFLFLREILKFGGNIPNFAPMLMINIMLFQCFQQTTTRGMRSLASREALVRKMQFPRIVIPLSTSLTAAISLALNLAVGSVLLLAFGLYPEPGWLALPSGRGGGGHALHRACVDPLGGLRAATRRGSALERHRPGGLLRHPDPLRDRAGPRVDPLDSALEPADADLRASCERPCSTRRRRAWWRPRAACREALAPVALGVCICVFSVWYFVREAPSVAEAL